MTDGGFHPAGPLDDLPVGVGRHRQVDGVAVLLCRTDAETVLAAQDSCPHLRLSMDGGRVRRGAILCPRHGALFDLATGKPLNGVTRDTLKVLPTRVVAGQVFVALDPNLQNGF